MSNTTAPKPALTPPPGVQSNFEHPESIVTLANVIVGICISVVTFFFVLRCYVRIFIRRTWIWEDAFASVAWAGTVAYCSAVAATMGHYGGRHLYDLTVPQSQSAGYWFSVATIVYGCAIPFTKLTILWLYRRVFVTTRWSPLDICIVTLAVVECGFYCGSTLLKIFQCTPREKIWVKNLPGTCVDTSVILNTSGYFNVTSDFLILFLPMYTILRLKMDLRKKVMVLLVFTFGACAPAFSIAGLVQRLRSSANKDFTWNQPRIQFWGAAELTTGFLCFCLPELAILFRTRQPPSGDNYYPTDAYGKPVGSHASGPGTHHSRASRGSAIPDTKEVRATVTRLDSSGEDSDAITPFAVEVVRSARRASTPRSPHVAERHRHHSDATPSPFSARSAHGRHRSEADPGYGGRPYTADPLTTVTVQKEFILQVEEASGKPSPERSEASKEPPHVTPPPTRQTEAESPVRRPSYWAQRVPSLEN